MGLGPTTHSIDKFDIITVLITTCLRTVLLLIRKLLIRFRTE